MATESNNASSPTCPVAGRILVTPRSLSASGHPALQRLEEAGYELVFSSPGKQPDERQLQQLLPGCVGYLAGVEKVSREVLAVADDLRVISRYGTGVDSIDLEAARERQVQVCRAEGANARSVAELTLALILALARGIPFCDHALKDGRWERRTGVELERRTLGLIGCGRIGRQVAHFALALGMRVLGYDPIPDKSFRPSDRFSYVTQDAVWAHSDVISLHCNPPQNGTPLVDATILARIQAGAFLVNTARASLIDEAAVLAALASGRLAGFATDVFPEEPPRGLRIIGHPRVIATPHIGGFTAESVARTAEVAVGNLLCALSGSRPSTCSRNRETSSPTVTPTGNRSQTIHAKPNVL